MSGNRAIGACLLSILVGCTTEPPEPLSDHVEIVESSVGQTRFTPSTAPRRPIEVPACLGRHCQGEFPSPLELDALSYDGEHLLFALRWQGRSVEVSPATQVPVVLVLANGFPIPAPRALGVVDSEQGSRSWIGVALSDLPDGELDVVLRVLGTEITLPLAKEGASLRHLSKSERAGYEYDPAAFVDPVTGATIAAEGNHDPAHDVFERLP